MMWSISNRADPRAKVIADRHYNRQKPESAQFVPPGRCVVLLLTDETALWVTSWPYAKYVKHAWAGAWVNSLFRNEGGSLSSKLILEACAVTCWKYGDPPKLGMITFIDKSRVRKKRDWGRCYRKAGFKDAGETKGGLIALQLLPEEFPPPAIPIGAGNELALANCRTAKELEDRE